MSGLDALLEQLTAAGIAHEPIETYSNGVRHTKIPDPDGNALAFAGAVIAGRSRAASCRRRPGCAPRAAR